jgi:formylglycine-generating enzyme required for sulfatase activity
MMIPVTSRRKHWRDRLALALLALFVWCVHVSSARAYDIQISNLVVHPYSGGNGEVEFDINWQSSWRATTEPYNWDAAWVFCKIRINGGDWAHLKLNTSGHTIPSTPLAITTAMGLVDTSAAHNASTNPALGIFLYRTNDGFGTFTANDVRLQWNYADNGASSGDVIEIRVFGIEMVYIPQGAFYAGDNATSSASFKQGSADNDPWSISSEDAFSTTNASTNGYYYVSRNFSEESATGAVFTIVAGFPKGYSSFYMMKGEISQGQWVAFFNTLTNTQKSIRDITSSDNNGKNTDGLLARNNVSWTAGEATLPDQGGGATYSGVAMNYLAWEDLAAYLDWSGLRPMSELEYEKAGRGPNLPVSGEYAWGTTTVTATTSISNEGLRNERGQSGANVTCGSQPSINGPLRVGSYAKGVDSRTLSGGSFYGVMELSGNVWEQAVTVGSTAGRAFRGRYHGDGSLAGNGSADVTTWPGTLGVGAGFRGGVFDGVDIRCRLSDRHDAAYELFGSSARNNSFGGRGVRSVP